MRAIKFRGLNPYSRQWKYGYYFITRQLVAQASIWQENDSPVSVDVETVGQYTGLQDRHGKDIYEGDIVKTSGDIKPLIIIFEDGASQIQGIDYYLTRVRASEWFIEIIGNIYEHPELLKS